MKKLENIDKLFSEGLYKYERQPRPQAWGKIEARLEKSKSKVLPIWWKYASAASIALLLGIGGYWINNQKNNSIEEVATNRKTFIKEKQAKFIGEQVISQVTIIESNIPKKTTLKINHKHKLIDDKQLDQLPIEQIIKVEEIKQIAKIPKIESKKTEEQNTIVLVLENTKPKIEEETIVLNMIETKPEVVAQSDLNDEMVKKETRLSKIWQQLKRAKNGENVNWSEVGIKPQKMLARADAKIENVLTKGESNEK